MRALTLKKWYQAKKEVANVEGMLRQQNEQIKEISEMLKDLVKTKDSNETKRGRAGN